MVYNFTVQSAHTYFVGDGKWWVHNKCPTFSQIREMIKRGRAPDGVVRFDVGDPKFHEKPHIHFHDNDAALNIDGTWKHHFADLTRKQIEWLLEIGWKLPK